MQGPAPIPLDKETRVRNRTILTELVFALLLGLFPGSTSARGLMTERPTRCLACEVPGTSPLERFSCASFWCWADEAPGTATATVATSRRAGAKGHWPARSAMVTSFA
jgi:hypothetical protein